MKRGKKSITWDRIRAHLKREFEQLGITACEMCGRTNFLSFAHRLKRRFITDDRELAMVALLCMDNPDGRGCHNLLEYGPKEEMYARITAIIEKRNEQINATA
jgi:4-hydroxy-3-methylbut-2-en-1-yl diphosphate synthase IspG/GcpE